MICLICIKALLFFCFFHSQFFFRQMLSFSVLFFCFDTFCMIKLDKYFNKIMLLSDKQALVFRGIFDLYQH